MSFYVKIRRGNRWRQSIEKSEYEAKAADEH